METPLSSRIGLGVSAQRFLSPALPAFCYLLLAGGLYLLRSGADVNYDGEIYIRAARAISLGKISESLHIYPMPALPALIALSQRWIEDWVQAGRFVSLTMTGLTIWPLYLLAKELFDRRAAFWGCVAFVLLPETLQQSNAILREASSLPFISFAVYFLVRAFRSRRIAELFAAAAAAIACCLFRIEGWVFFVAAVPFFILFFLAYGRRPTGGLRHEVRLPLSWFLLAVFFSAILYLLIALVPDPWNSRFSDWKVFFREITGGQFWETSRQIAERLDHLQVSSLNPGVGQNFATTVRIWMPLIYLLGLVQLWAASISTINLLPLTLGFVRAPFAQKHVAVLCIVAGLGLMSLFFFIRQDVLLRRYFFTPTVLLCPWIGLGIASLIDMASRKTSGGRLGPAILVCTLVFWQASTFDKFFKNPDNLARQAATWIFQNTDLNNRSFAFNDQVVQFHLELIASFETKTFFSLCGGKGKDVDGMLALARQHDVDYIVFDEAKAGSHHKERFPGYRPIVQFERKQRLITVYGRPERLDAKEPGYDG